MGRPQVRAAIKLSVALLISLGALLLLSTDRSLAVAGYRPIVITSGSMEPGIARGDVLIISDSRAIRVGDVVTYKPSTGRVELITHRVVGIEKTTEGLLYYTKGDSNRSADAYPVPEKNVAGVSVRRIPRIGLLALLARNTTFLLLTFSILAVSELTVWASALRRPEKTNNTSERNNHVHAIKKR